MLRVMIVDDEAAEREGLRSLLLQGGYAMDIVLKESSEEACKALEEGSFDILISDIVMPHLDGLTLCTRAIALHPRIVTIISSAYSDFQYTQSAIRIGVDDYLLKPIIIDAFQKTIDRAISLVQKKSGEKPIGVTNFKDSTSHLIREVQSLIQEHYREPIGLEWVAEKMYLSPGYLSNLFKKETNRTVMQYITLCRMRRVCYLLTTTNIKINQIGQDVGYPNSSYFCYLFRKIFDITPNQLREGVPTDVMEKIQSILE